MFGMSAGATTLFHWMMAAVNAGAPSRPLPLVTRAGTAQAPPSLNPVHPCPAHPHTHGFASCCTHHLHRGRGTLLPSNPVGLCQRKGRGKCLVWLCIGKGRRQCHGAAARACQERRAEDEGMIGSWALGAAHHNLL
ncbi:uncharacterized protein [Triticum aestivum]|uniref:uncharacterized protein n=1 Tax=Triticum aestivum TaxID=4565 RepID=UPI001D035A50|nr:uncharacterized protein LOC123069655 [Triticum aestivum]